VGPSCDNVPLVRSRPRPWKVLRTGASVWPFPWQYVNASDIYREASVQGNADSLPLGGGQSMGVMHDLPGAAEVIETTMREARALLLEWLPKTVQLDQ